MAAVRQLGDSGVSERICEVEGCGNLGKPDGHGRRKPLCDTHHRLRYPPRTRGRILRQRQRNIERNAERLLAGEQIRAFSSHHRAVRLALGGARGDGLTVSRTCPDDCPQSWLGWHSSHQQEYRLCIPAHYVLETQAENNARKVAA